MGLERALVTGANGLIGANLVRELVSRGVHVRAMTRPDSDCRALNGVEVERVVGDVRDGSGGLVALARGCDVVFHAAAQFTYAHGEETLAATATEGTRNVIRAAAGAGVARVVVTSSSVVFGSSDRERVRDETSRASDDFVEAPYVASKVKQDAVAAETAAEVGVEVVFVCPTLSVGPHGTALGPSNGLVVAYLSDPLRLTWPGGCNVVSVRDVAWAHWIAAVHGAPGERYLAGGENLTWRAVHTTIAELCGVPSPRHELDHTTAWWASVAEELRAGVTGRPALTTRQQARMVGRYYWYRHDKIAALGYAPMSASDALAVACAWLAQSPHVSREVRATLWLSAEAQSARRRFLPRGTDR